MYNIKYDLNFYIKTKNNTINSPTPNKLINQLTN